MFPSGGFNKAEYIIMKVFNSDFRIIGVDLVPLIRIYSFQISEFVLIFRYWFLDMKVLNSDFRIGVQ